MLDYLIIGAGLSGISLAHRLHQQDKSFAVLANKSQQSSVVAGGIFNPVILKRFTLAWEADAQLKKAIPFYKSVEKQLSVGLLNFMPIYRRFASVKEQNDWFAATDNPSLSSFLSTELVSTISGINSSFCFGKVCETGVLNTRQFLESYQAFLTKNDQFIEGSFDFNELKIKDDFIEYKNIQAKKVVFCEGFGMLDNPYFNKLPLQGNKGEYVIIHSKELQLTSMLKSSVFIIPLRDNQYKVGASYERDFSDQQPTNEKKSYLLKKLDEIIDCGYEVVKQEAGIRPTVPDRRPLLGQHPAYKNLYICNGFGSRGVLIAPSASQLLFDFMEFNAPLPKEVDCQRYF